MCTHAENKYSTRWTYSIAHCPRITASEPPARRVILPNITLIHTWTTSALATNEVTRPLPGPRPRNHLASIGSTQHIHCLTRSFPHLSMPNQQLLSCTPCRLSPHPDVRASTHEHKLCCKVLRLGRFPRTSLHLGAETPSPSFRAFPCGALKTCLPVRPTKCALACLPAVLTSS